MSSQAADLLWLRFSASDIMRKNAFHLTLGLATGLYGNIPPKNPDLNPGALCVLPQSVSRGLEVDGKGQPVLRWLLMEIRAPSTWPCFDFHFDRLKGSCPSCGSNSKLKPQLCSEQDMRLTSACARRACTGEATPRGPQTSPIFRTQNQGTRSSLMKTTSARQKALAKLKCADRNVLDASQC